MHFLYVCSFVSFSFLEGSYLSIFLPFSFFLLIEFFLGTKMRVVLLPFEVTMFFYELRSCCNITLNRYF